MFSSWLYSCQRNIAVSPVSRWVKKIDSKRHKLSFFPPPYPSEHMDFYYPAVKCTMCLSRQRVSSRYISIIWIIFFFSRYCAHSVPKLITSEFFFLWFYSHEAHQIQLLFLYFSVSYFLLSNIKKAVTYRVCFTSKSSVPLN